MSCGKTMGHGEACNDGHECDQCREIIDLKNDAEIVHIMAVEDNQEYRNQIAELKKENSTHIMMRDVIKEELKKVMEENNSLTESLAKYKDLFDPHNLLDL
jgi:chorismate mutase